MDFHMNYNPDNTFSSQLNVSFLLNKITFWILFLGEEHNTNLGLAKIIIFTGYFDWTALNGRKMDQWGRSISQQWFSVVLLDSEWPVWRCWIQKDQCGGIGFGRISVAVLDSEGSVWRYWIRKDQCGAIGSEGSVGRYWIQMDQCGGIGFKWISVGVGVLDSVGYKLQIPV